MKTATKIITIVLIIIIVVAIGAAAYIYQQNAQSNQPTPTPTPTPSPTVTATVTTTNQTVAIGLGGSITQTQISNVEITPDQSAAITTVSFNVTGSSGTGSSNMTIPKTAIPYGNTPTVYIDSAVAADQGYVQNANNYYVWYTTSFSTHQIIITFIESVTPTPSPTHSASPTASPSPAPTPTPTPSPTTLNVATTTSLHDTGLEDLGIDGNTTGTLKTAFQTKYPWVTVNFVALGTGDAIKRAQAGDADMILVHSPSQELTFLNNSYGVDRKIVAYNFFVIVGPANDPAGIAGMTNVSQALTTLYNAAQTNIQVQWVARNDSSGTATAEQNLWKAAGFNYTTLLNTQPWFHATGQGMGTTLQIANNGIGGGSPMYLLSDTGTYLSYSKQGNIPQLTVEIQAQKALLNVYSAIIDDPRNAALTDTNFAASLLFVNYLVSDEGQQLIGNYGQSTYGQQLFAPFVPLASGTAPNATLLGWIQSYAYMSYNTATNSVVINASGTECPAEFRYNAGSLYSPSYDTVSALNASAQIVLPNYYITDQHVSSATYSQPSGKLFKA